MDNKSNMLKVARIAARKFDNYADIPLVIIGGSVGDPYGYVTSKSDIDLLVYTENPEYFENEPAIDWTPYNFRRKNPANAGVIDLVNKVEGNHNLSAFFNSKYKPSDMPERFAEMQSESDKVKRSEFDGHLVCFNESKLYKDDLNLYPEGKDVGEDLFNEQRYRFAKKILKGMNIEIIKTKEDLEMSREFETIDLMSYNRRVIDIVNGMTYILCCARNIPKSYGSIGRKRNNVLWKALGLDIETINATISSTENLDQSFDALRNIVENVWKDYKFEFSNTGEDYKIVKRILE